MGAEQCGLVTCLVAAGASRLDYTLKIWPAPNCRPLQISTVVRSSRSEHAEKRMKARPRQVSFKSVTGNLLPPELPATAAEWLLACLPLMRNVCGPAQREAVLASTVLI